MADDVKRTIVEAASFLSRNQSPVTPDSAAPNGTGSTDLVDTAIESLLGARPENPRDFRTLLDRAFVVEEKDGHTEVTYRRPSTAGAMMISGGGALTGAQATIVGRATAARAEIFDNLDPLVPLKLTPDPDLVRDVRALIHETVDQIVAELSTPGGPNIVRVNQLITELAGDKALVDPAAALNPNSLQGLVGRLQFVFGMTRRNVSSLDDERTLTSFLTIVSTVATLCFGWLSDRDFLDPLNGRPFLGTQIVQIERSLAVLAQAVTETRQALYRAEVEPAEQYLPLGAGSPTISIGSVLSWVESFAKTGGNRLRYGGTDGLKSFSVEAGELHKTVDQLIAELSKDPEVRLSGSGSIPVLESLKVLSDRVQTAKGLTDQLQPGDPTITGVALTASSSFTAAGAGWEAEDPALSLEIEGTRFDPEVTVIISGDDRELFRRKVSSVSDTKIVVLDLPRGDHRSPDVITRIRVKQESGSGTFEIGTPPQADES